MSVISNYFGVGIILAVILFSVWYLTGMSAIRYLRKKYPKLADKIPSSPVTSVNSSWKNKQGKYVRKTIFSTEFDKDPKIKAFRSNIVLFYVLFTFIIIVYFMLVPILALA
jgi:hypothetical protein